MRFRSLGAFGALAALAAVIVAVVPAAGGTTAQATGTYIVQMAQSPVVAYEGGIAGFERTKPAKGEKINPNSAAVRKYAGYLDGKHAEALQKVGGGQKVYDYRFSYNGFAAKLTEK